MTRSCVLAVQCAAGALVMSPLAFAGGLTPPGIPGPTMKALDVVEPRIPVGPLTTPGDADSVYRITQPGSYYLTGNITGVNGRHGVQITASGVTLDLMGFDLMGTPGSLSGVNSEGSIVNVRVHNGSAREWGGTGVDLGGTRNAHVSFVLSQGNDGYGILSGLFGVVIDSTANGNGLSGVATGLGSVVSRCVAAENGALGSGSGAGFSVATGTTIVDSAAYDNARAGIDASGSSLIARCTAVANGDDGVEAGAASRVVDCVATANAQAGISLLNDSTAQGNTCDGNTVAGIVATGPDSVIDGNTATDNAVGVQVTASGCLVVRNRASGNTTNYSIGENNRYGPIINITATGAAAATGNSAVSTLSTTDAWANLAY